ncbi:MAG: type II toxin-antitoxin system RelE/ParE family toxin [Candidatus Andeanibacterium colombiense]|uniref:Type II toxin-antitoxin system RelE/ParE family toxin n=1 Tax=Candidatus Andeanibacterium colombiense TaxID=3121345 RepID=A0AAJ5X3X3_9SPHN|nr:MAG: type II toxin-antitoxin system RelE/ParE family toxin [Sphingomonadaceae bacterium]
MTGKSFEVELTRDAEDDLEAIHAWLAEHRSAKDADALLDGLLEAVGTLEQFPLRGSVPAELDAFGVREYRQVLFAPYRLIYRVIGTTVFVFVIADGRRDMQALLERRLLAR